MARAFKEQTNFEFCFAPNVHKKVGIYSLTYVKGMLPDRSCNNRNSCEYKDCVWHSKNADHPSENLIDYLKP